MASKGFPDWFITPSEAARIATAELDRPVSFHQVRKACVDGFVEEHVINTATGSRRGVHRRTFLAGVQRYMEERCSGPLTVSMKAHHQGRREANVARASEGELDLSNSSAVEQMQSTDAGQEGGEALPNIVLSKQRQEHWKAVKLELDQRERLNQLLRREDVEKANMQLHRRVVDAVMRTPSQAAIRLPQLRPQDVDVLKELMWGALREISGGLEVE